MELIVLARKPLSESTVAANVLRWGTGAINVDRSRIPHRSQSDLRESEHKNQHTRYANPSSNRDSYSGDFPPRTDYSGASGRWPANVILSHSLFCTDDLCDPTCPVAILDAQSGRSRSSGGQASLGAFRSGAIYGKGRDEREQRDPGYGDSGGASRFFYVAKSSRSERGQGNSHPTVKPIALMTYLCRLICPPGGLILDPFAGSGTTGIAALREGFDFIGIEREPEYVAIAEARLASEKGSP